MCACLTIYFSVTYKSTNGPRTTPPSPTPARITPSPTTQEPNEVPTLPAATEQPVSKL